MSESYPWEVKRRNTRVEPVAAPEPVVEYVPEPEAVEVEPEVEAEDPAPTPVKWPKK